MQEHLLKIGEHFFNINREELLKRIENVQSDLIEEWNNKTSIEDFYKNTELYILDLIKFNTEDRVLQLIYPVFGIKGAKILDFGGGIGEIGLSLANNNTIYYYDIGVANNKFVKLSSTITNRPINILSEKEVYENNYDMIITSDIFEHLTNPIETLDNLFERLNNNGLFLTTGLVFSTHETLPMHLKQNLEKREQFDKYLNSRCKLLFFHQTGNEVIYLWQKK